MPLGHSSGVFKVDSDIELNPECLKDLKIPDFSPKYLQPYTDLHPFTQEFVQRFGLDTKLFKPRSNNQITGQKRSYYQMKEPLTQQQPSITTNQATAVEESKDSNEIDLDL